MKKRLLILIVLSSINFSNTFGQPGGDGGVNIRELFDYNLVQLKLDTSKVKIKVFSINSDGLLNFTFKNIKYKFFFKLDTIGTGWNGLYAINAIDSLYPIINRIENIYSIKCSKIPYFYLGLKMGKTHDSNQRLELILNTDTMTIDFLNLLPPSGMGRNLTIDSLVFCKGFFIYDISKSTKNNIYKTNLTPSAMDILSDKGIIRKFDKIEKYR